MLNFVYLVLFFNVLDFRKMFLLLLKIAIRSSLFIQKCTPCYFVLKNLERGIKYVLLSLN